MASSTWTGWAGSLIGNKWMTYDDANFPAQFTYDAAADKPMLSFATRLPQDHQLLKDLHPDLVPRTQDGSAWLVGHLLYCSGCVVGIGKPHEFRGDGDNGKDYWTMHCFIPVEHASDKLPWPTHGVSYVGIFYEKTITRDSANAMLYCDRIPILEGGLEVNVELSTKQGVMTYTVKTEGGIRMEINVDTNADEAQTQVQPDPSVQWRFPP